ncbi:MAG: TetR/AcrR family transcriptional regulator [Phenylobacterium sp.]|nr:TetR/AcrR family transcriptional regulator [Phenylobacterium sp.]
MTLMLPNALKPRSKPQQARSRATHSRILEVSAELLAEVGMDGFNTNLLAERAGLGPRAIYRYFPNKHAILVALTEEIRAAERAWIGDLRRLGDSGDWRRGIEQAIDGYFQGALGLPGYAALRVAAEASPEIRALDLLSSKELEDDLAAGLKAVGLDLEPPHMAALCQTVMESANRILEIALRRPKGEAALLVRELKLMIVALLERYLCARP